MNDSVNSQITTSISNINSYAQQIAKLNDTISQALNSNSNQPPNDLMDQRDQLVANMSKEVKVTVVEQQGSYNISIGNGQPLVVGNKSYSLTTVNAPDDPTKLVVGYTFNGNTSILPSQTVTGRESGRADTVP